MGEKLLEMLAKNLVNNPDSVAIKVETGADGIVMYKLNVAKDDMGRIIGRNGRIAKAIRTIMKVAALKENKKIEVEIVDEA